MAWQRLRPFSMRAARPQAVSRPAGAQARPGRGPSPFPFDLLAGIAGLVFSDELAHCPGPRLPLAHAARPDRGVVPRAEVHAEPDREAAVNLTHLID
jgi:hypothetical protein